MRQRGPERARGCRHADGARLRHHRWRNQAVASHQLGHNQQVGRRVDEYLDVAEHVVALARRGGADAADAVLDSGLEFSVTVRRGEVEKLLEASARGLGLRVFRGGRCAVTYTSDLAPPALAQFVEQALDLAAITDPDPFSGLPDP